MTQWAVPGYTEVRQLGAGATGRVVLAVHDESQQQVAIKYLASRLVQDPGFLARFRDEARLLMELDVPQVVRLYEYAEESSRGAAIVMELVNGASLHEMISRRGPTGPESALAVLKGSLLGLAAAHAMGVVHRDYKPENVLVDTTGNSKLADFGVAVKAGRRVPSAGTPLYMAPEQWQGAEASPATDIYAATAVFYECLTGEPPFSGRIGQLRREHEHTAVPAGQVEEPLRGLVSRGMAKDPADRPADAASFVAELELAADAYGADWEERGREHLAERVAALLLLLIRGGVTGASVVATASTWLGRHRVQAVVAAAGVVVLAIAGAVTAVAAAGGHGSGQSTLADGPSATASVAPLTAAQSCATPASFAFSGSITARHPGTVRYHWVFSNGTVSATGALNFTKPGSAHVTGQAVEDSASGTGWGQLQVTGSQAATSGRAVYQLTCTTKNFSASASVKPATQTVTCGSTPSAFAFSGTITSMSAATVTYHWALSNGTTSASQQLKFTAAGTQPVKPYTFTPGPDNDSTGSDTGSGSLVITSPVAAASNKAAFSLSCTTSGVTATLTSAPKSPATFPCGAASPGFTVTGAITAAQAATVTYHWVRSDGSSTPPAAVSVGAGQTVDVTDQWTPPTSPFSGGDTLDITAPTAVTSSIPLALSCTGSHVTGIKVSAGSPNFDGNSGTATFVITFTTDGTSPVTLSWSTSQNTSPTPGTVDVENGSKTVSGSTSYTVDVTGVFSPPCGAGTAANYWVIDATATGTDGHGASAVSSVDVTRDCD
jgi:eukaryotic-like serine/threonine-protein kinase